MANKPPFLAAIRGGRGFRVVPKRTWSRGKWFNLWREGDRFPLAGGPMTHIMRVYAAL